MLRVLAGLALFAVCFLPVAAGDAAGFGAKLTLDEATPIAKIIADPHAYEGKLVQVSGPLTEVCAHMGCWMKIGDDEGHSLLAKSTGDKITIPTDSAGKRAVVEGVVVVDHTDEKKHEAEKGHDCPTAKIRLETKGVVLG